MPERRIGPEELKRLQKSIAPEVLEKKLIEKDGSLYINDGDLSPQEQLNQIELGSFGIKDALAQALSQKSPEFGLTRDDLDARFGNKKSELYIENPFVRQSVIERSLGGQQQAFSTISSRLENILGLQATQAEQRVLAAEKQAEEEQRQFENKLALQELELKRQQINNDANPSPAEVQGTIDDYAQFLISGRITESQIPQDYRLPVLQEADIFKTSPVGSRISSYLETLRNGEGKKKTRESLIDQIMDETGLYYEDVADTVYTFIPDDVEAGLKSDIASSESQYQKLLEMIGGL